MNNPGSVSMRMPRLARRLSLERMFSVFLGTMGKSRAWHRSRARRGRPASAKTARIYWQAGLPGSTGDGSAGSVAGSPARESKVLRVIRR